MMNRNDLQVRMTFEMEKETEKLIQTARFLVEVFIEGSVSEEELMAAHCEPEKDVALLARMTSKGWDVQDVSSLFPDIQQLRELLDEADKSKALE
jgi:hypothetical protein